MIPGEFTLHSNDLSGQLTKTQEFSGFGCDGKNISPALVGYMINAHSLAKATIVSYYGR